MKKFIILALAFVPAFASAQNLGNLQQLLEGFSNLVQMALPVVAGLALLAFFWGLAKFIFAAGDEESKADGKRIMIWGIVALFVMVSVWGLVGFIGTALNINATRNPTVVPTVPFNP